MIEKSFGNSRIYIGFHTQYQYFIYDGTYQDNIGYGKLCIYLVSADDTVIVDKSDYAEILKNSKENKLEIIPEFNYRLAKKAFSYVSNYDASISNHLGILNIDNSKNKMPETLTLHFEKAYDLRYGENPHQEASFFIQPGVEEACVANSKQLQGKELSLNNIYDADSCFETVTQPF